MKKLLALLTALFCALSLSVVAFADVVAPTRVLFTYGLPFLLAGFLLIAAAVALVIVILKRKKAADKNEDQ